MTLRETSVITKGGKSFVSGFKKIFSFVEEAGPKINRVLAGDLLGEPDSALARNYAETDEAMKLKWESLSIQFKQGLYNKYGKVLVENMVKQMELLPDGVIKNTFARLEKGSSNALSYLSGFVQLKPVYLGLLLLLIASCGAGEEGIKLENYETLISLNRLDIGASDAVGVTLAQDVELTDKNGISHISFAGLAYDNGLVKINDVKSIANGYSYDICFHSNTVPDGSYDLDFKVEDGEGNLSTKTITIEVARSEKGPTIFKLRDPLSGAEIIDIQGITTQTIPGSPIVIIDPTDPDGETLTFNSTINLSATMDQDGNIVVSANPSTVGSGSETVTVSNKDDLGNVTEVTYTIPYNEAWANDGVNNGTLIDADGNSPFPDTNNEPFATEERNGIGGARLITYNGQEELTKSISEFYNLTPPNQAILNTWLSPTDASLSAIVDGLFANYSQFPNSPIPNVVNDEVARKIIFNSPDSNEAFFVISYANFGKAILGFSQEMNWSLQSSLAPNVVDKFTNDRNVRLYEFIRDNTNLFLNEEAGSLIQFAEFEK